jgi:hypothetical protein
MATEEPGVAFDSLHESPRRLVERTAMRGDAASQRGGYSQAPSRRPIVESGPATLEYLGK